MRQTWKIRVSFCPQHEKGLVGEGQERTRVLMVAAPMLFMTWTASSMTNMRTSNEGILSVGGYPLRCALRSCRTW